MEQTVAQKLQYLLKLQSIDSQLDELKKVRGALPDEVRDLEDEVEGYNTRIENINKEIESLESDIESNRIGIKDAEKLISKYEEQQMQVRNNREYDAITKEIELQKLEVQILEKKIKESYEKIEVQKEQIDKTAGAKDERVKDLDSKKQELDVIISESEEEEAKLEKDREKASSHIEERLLNSYNKIRNNARNGLAIVTVKRGACGGCFNITPPQRQVDIRDKKKLIVCEHCGRILADVEDEIEEEKPKKTRRKKAAAK
jgi:hypothetical protein